ncbi:hypothetical protein DYP11_20880 [Escherichia coli]|nr:hypothetical protein [Escherichia coli]
MVAGFWSDDIKHPFKNQCITRIRAPKITAWLKRQPAFCGKRSVLSAGALRMPDTSEAARDFSLAWSLTPQVRKL